MSTTVPNATGDALRSLRPTAIIAGASLAAMAVLAPIAVFAAIPAGATAAAGAILLGVAVLDVIVAYTLVAVLDPGDGTLGRIATGLRLAYAAAFAVAASRLLTADDAAGFEQIWDASLFIFAAHLIAVGVVGWRMGTLPRWISVLVVLAGGGYLVDAVAPAFGMELAVSTISFVGEVVLLLWLLIRGGTGKAPRRENQPTFL